MMIMAPSAMLMAQESGNVAPQSRENYFGEELAGRNKAQSTVKHHFEINAGFITGGKLRVRNEGQKFKTNFSRPYVEVVYGARLNDYLFVGVGTGVQYAYGDCKLMNKLELNTPESWGLVAMPIYGNVKACYPVSRMVTPYISVGVGGNVVLASNFSDGDYGKIRGGLFCKFGAGLTISKFNFGLGMTSQNMKWLNEAGATNFKIGVNSFYVEAGVKF